MEMTKQEKQNLMDSIYGKSYDDRWHTVVSDMDLEEFKLPRVDLEVDNGNDD